jgi:PKD repeat protein
MVTILMENENACSVYGGCGGSGTYETQLANQYVYVTTWGTINHNSEPNYIALFGAINDGSTSNDGVCCYFETTPNLIDKFEPAGITWTAFAEGAGSSGTCSFSPPRMGDHFPFIDYSDMNTASRCSHFLTTTAPISPSGPVADPEFLSMLNSPNPSNFVWLTPNDNDNGHDTGVAGADAYLSNLVPLILSSSEFTTTRATLLLIYDEGYSQCANTGGTGECVYASFSGPAAKKAVQIGPPNASHYSYAATLEAAWGLSSINSNDAGAPNMLSAFNLACTTNCPLSTSFTTVPSLPLVNAAVTFTALTTGGTIPYSTNWTFGDGGTGTGTVAAHTYTTAGSFTVTETVTDSSSPQRTATASQTITVFSSLIGNFGACASLPQGWNCGNIVPGAPTPTSAQIVNGVFESRQSNPGLGGSNSYYYSTTQKGTFPWTPCTAPAAGVIPTGITSVSVNFTSLTYNPGLSPSADRYHIYIALYYWLPNGPVSAGGSTYQCLDTQVRVENIGGSFSPIGSTATYNPGDSFGWDNVTLQISPGQTGLLVANVANQCLQDLQAWGIPTSTPCQLAGIEIGTEGYQFQELDVNWYDVSLNVGPVPLTTSFTASPSSPIVNAPVTFTSSSFGGASPYTISWNFGDGSTGSGTTVIHTYTSANTYSVTETATDSASPSQSTKSSQTITVQPIPPLATSFTFLPATPLFNTVVTFMATTTGGTSPYATSWNFGDGKIGTGASTTHTFATAGSYTVTETATDSSSPTKTATATLSVVVYASLPLSASFSVSSTSPQVGQTVTFSATATGGTSPYTFAIDFGDGITGTGTSASHTYFTATTYTATLTVADSASPQATLSKTIIISVQGVAPALTILGNQTVVSGTWINFTVSGASNSGGAVTLSATGLPAGASFDPSTGAFSWRPSQTQTGSYIITFTATDSSSPASPTSKAMQIQVSQAAPGGSSGGSGGSGGSSSGGCLFCGLIPRTAGTLTLLAVGGLIGLVFSLTLLTFRAHASLERTKKRLRV